MKRNTLLKMVNLFMLLTFIGIVLIVALRRFVTSEIFYTIHPKLGYLFIILAVTHLRLNWNWVKTNFLKKKKRKQ